MAVGDYFVIDKLRYVVLTESGSTGTVSVGAASTSITGEVIIPETVTNNNITYTVTKIRTGSTDEDRGFRGCSSVTTLYISKTIIGFSTSAYYNAFRTSFSWFEVDKDNQYFSSEDGVLFNKSKTQIYRYPGNRPDLYYKIPESVLSVLINGFDGAQLKYIEFNNQKNISYGNSSFGDSYIKKLIFKNYESIGVNAMNDMPYLKELVLDPRIPNRTHTWMNNIDTALKKVTIGKNITSMSSSTFNGSLKIERVDVDSQYVVDNFKDFFPQITSSTSPLKYVNIGDSVTSIGDNAFYSGSSLVEINIGKNVQSIGSASFFRCNHLKYLNIPAGCTFNGGRSLQGTTIYDLTIPSGVQFYSTDLYNSGIRKLTINSDITKLTYACFSWCWALRKLVINSNNLSTIDSQCFDLGSDYPLKSYRFPNTLTTIKTRAFARNKGTVSFVFEGNCPSSVQSDLFSGSSTGSFKVYYYQDTIGWGSDFYGVATQKVFRGEVTSGNFTYKFVDGIGGTPNVSVRAATNVKLSGVLNIPQTVTIESVTYTVRYIMDSGFENQFNITSFDMHNQYLEIGKNAFKGCKNLETVSNTTGITDIGEGAFDGCRKLQSFVFNPNDNNVYTPIEKNTFRNCESLTSVTLPTYCYDIKESAFEGCKRLQSISIPDECNHIYRNAFKGCKSLQTMSYGENLYEIHENAFLGCSRLTTITVPVTNILEEIQDKAFYGCYELQNAPISSIKRVGKYAFYNNFSLTSLTLPATIDYINDYAFGNCKNLSTLTNNSPANADFGENVFLGTNISI